MRLYYPGKLRSFLKDIRIYFLYYLKGQIFLLFIYENKLQSTLFLLTMNIVF